MYMKSSVKILAKATIDLPINGKTTGLIRNVLMLSVTKITHTNNTRNDQLEGIRHSDLCENKEGNIISNQDDIQTRWLQYFKEPLNNTSLEWRGICPPLPLQRLELKLS